MAVRKRILLRPNGARNIRRFGVSIPPSCFAHGGMDAYRMAPRKPLSLRFQRMTAQLGAQTHCSAVRCLRFAVVLCTRQSRTAIAWQFVNESCFAPTGRSNIRTHCSKYSSLNSVVSVGYMVKPLRAPFMAKIRCCVSIGMTGTFSATSLWKS